MNLRCLVLLCCLLPFTGSAQLPVNPVFQHIMPEKAGVNKLTLQTWDRQGHAWMASEKGLVCYNGYSSTIWSNKKNDTNSPLENTIQALYVDRQQRIWLAYVNTGGVSRFDPVKEEFTHFLPDSTRPTAIPNVGVVRFQEDSKNRFWILTWGAGLVQMNPETGDCNVHRPNTEQPFNKSYIPHDKVKSMVEMKDGRFLLGFFEEGSPYSAPAFFDADKIIFEPFPIEDYLIDVKEPERSKILYVIHMNHFIHVDRDQNIWIGTYSGLVFIDTKKHTSKRISGQIFEPGRLNLDNTRNYVTDESGRMWIGTPNKGLMVVDMRTCKAGYLRHSSKIPTSIADNRIGTLAKDHDGNIWISTGTGAISIYNPLIQQFNILSWENMDLDYTNQSEQPVPVNQMFIKNKNEIYVSSENGLTVYNGEKDEIIERIKSAASSNLKHESTKSTNRIGNFKFLADGNMLFISPELPRVYKTKSKNFIAADASENFEGRSMRIFFRHKAYNERIFLFNNATSRIYEYDISKNRVNRFCRVGPPFERGSIHNVALSEHYSHILPSGKWMLSAGKEKFVLFNPQDTTQWTVYSHHSGSYFPDSTINTAYLDPRGKIWICTDNGLYLFDEKTGKSEYWSKKIGLDLMPVKAMITDKNGICWLALEKYIARWDPHTNKTFVFRSELGLNVGSFIGSVAQTDEEGNIYLASINGILRYDPEKLKVPDSQPQVQLSFLSIKEDTIKGQELQRFAREKTFLDWNENFLNMEFSTNQVYTPAPHHFYYRLVGLDSTWQDNGTSNRLRYTNLSDGEYTLEVKIMNVYNVESEVLRIRFSIARPFWKAWWFYVLAAAILVSGIWVMVRLRERAHRKREEELEQGIRERTAEIVAKAEEIRLQKDIIEDKNKELTDSIHYAQKIQQSILPNREDISKYLPEHFILFKPKDIVSGDFYWFTHQQDSVLWAVVDCTGHGVPGGFMSMLGSGLLNQIVNEELRLEPGEVLNQLRERVIVALKQTGSIGENRDGMDIGLCRYIPSSKKLQFAGANNPLYLVRNGSLQEITADKQPIGIHTGEKKPFATSEIILEKGDLLYLSSDGYADQFGGEKGKKFKTSNFEKLLVRISASPMPEQLKTLESTFVNWKADYEQLDDVCVVGVKI